MAGDCHFLNPLRRDGTSQRQRLLQALRPTYVAIDERSTADLLLYARNYAELLQYYTESNTPGGNWVEFLENDISVLIAIIGDVDATAAKKSYKAISDAVVAAAPADQPQALATLFEMMFALQLTVDSWYRRSVDGLSLQRNIEQFIHSVLNDSLRGLLAIAIQANNAGLAIDVDTSAFSDIWSLQNVEADDALFTNTPPLPDDYSGAMVRITELFNRSYEVYVKIVEQAPDYLDETLESYPQHEPHVALFITFVLLLKHAQEQLNTLTGKHLNFYYEEVLQLSRKPAVADQVHIIFELAKRMAPEQVAEDTELKAGKDNLGGELLYGLDDEVVVYHALINSEVGLKSLYVDKQGDDEVINIYAASDADSADGLGAEIEDEEGKWLTFGGDTMPYARIGFAIASPMLFLAEGERSITVRLYLQSKPDYFNSPARERVEQELQYNVRVTASGAEEWLELSVSSVTLVSKLGHAFIEFSLLAEAGQPAIVAYDAEVYGDQIQTKYPLLRFILDNTGLPASNDYDLADTQEIDDYSDALESYPLGELVRYDGKVYRAIKAITKKGFRPDVSGEYWHYIPYAYPYKYFQNQQLEKIQISTTVQGLRSLILENDVGVLNPSKPFYPFGTVPKANSSFLIGSNEVFNKSLNSLTLNAEWADLPSENFSSYYAAYLDSDNAPIVDGNEYFTARGYLLAEGEWQKLDMQYREEAEDHYPLGEEVTALAYNSDLDRIAIAHRGGIVTLRATADGKLFPPLEQPEFKKSSAIAGKIMRSLVFSPDGSVLAAVLGNGDAIFWNIRTKKAMAYESPDKSAITRIAFSKGMIAMSRANGTLQLWELADDIADLTDDLSGDNIKGGNAGKLSGPPEGHSSPFKPSGGISYQLSEGGEVDVNDLRFSPDGRTLSAALGSGELVIIDLQRVRLSKLAGHEEAIRSCEFSPDGERIITASDDGSAILWDARNRTALYELNAHSAGLTSASFSSDGKYLLTAASDGLVNLWLTQGGPLLASYAFGSGLADARLREDTMELYIARVRAKGAKMFVRRLQQAEDVELFLPEGENDPPLSERTFYIESDDGAIVFNPQQESFTRFSNSLRQGFLRLQLNHSFLQEYYPKFVAAAAKGSEVEMPNAPYVPMMASLSIDYVATQVVAYAQMKLSDYEERVEQLFHLSPFGFSEIYPIADQANPGKVLVDRHIVPHFPVMVTAEDESPQEKMAEGTLYIGIEKLQPAQNLSILFQLAEGSETKDLAAQPITWSYLADNRWVDFSSDEILTERTNGLLTSGIIEFAMPKGMSSDDSILPASSSDGLHWIKASVYENSAAVCKLIALHAQAAVASFRDHDNDPLHLQTALAAQTIGKLKSRIAAIKSVAQPYASFGGKMAESDTEFQVRVSERLRHKGRGVTIFDYERLVLEAFPEVYKVKCINHTSLTSEYQPGAVKLIVVPDLRNKNAVDPFAPRLSLNKRESIKKFLQQLVSDFVQIEVSDPQYEQVYVDFKVRFKQGVDKGFYQNLLNKDIINFLSPWLTDEGADLQFGGRIHRSVILKYIEDRSYVEFVTDFRMDQLIDGLVLEDIEIATASTSSSVLVSARQHSVDPEAESCEDREAAAVASGGVVPAPAASAGDVADYRYLGNRRSREMHDLNNTIGSCQIDEIDEKWRLYFSTTEEGTGMGYDYCAFCFGGELSKQ